VPVDDVRQAVEGMDIVISSVPKLQTHPVHGAWLSTGTLMIPLDVTGSWDDSVYASAQRIVCDHRGNLELAFQRYRPGLDIDQARLVDMQDIVSGDKPGRMSAPERILAFMTGIGSIDMAVAWEVFRRADKQNRGQRFALT